MSKAALLDEIERERLIWEQLLEAVGKERMEQPGAAGAWSFKDVGASAPWPASTPPGPAQSPRPRPGPQTSTRTARPGSR